MSDTPQLIEVDLIKTTRYGSNELTVGPTYLCLIHGCYFIGKFGKVWFGLNFNGWHGCGLQYDPPGTNASRWQRVWRFDNAQDIINQQHMWQTLAT